MDTVDEGTITSRRKVVDVGDSKAVTLPRRWLEFQRWLGKEVSEVMLVANSVVVLVPPGKEEDARRILKELEKENAATVAAERS